MDMEKRFSKCWVCGKPGTNEDGASNVRMWNNGFCACDCDCRAKYDIKNKTNEAIYCEGYGKERCCGKILMETLGKRHHKYRFIGDLPHYPKQDE